ncbi:unnamed protein product [Nezara viridula]|uniref:CSN8/PSMD8/EIF3K domain-containing protein n=1 Tax=Nezara viridula TaxID=85310 RepID=A0A9P0E8I2_NEZVI|nr:unnamed protein product [Nezara viridula]
MVNENWDQIAEDLEKQELQAQGGVSSPQLYGQLLAIYLYQNDLCNAKFLWKRIPNNIKTQNPELGNIWAVGKAMWLRDAVEIHKTLNNTHWSDNVSSIIKALKDRIKERGIRLIGRAYSSINADVMGSLLGMSSIEAVALAKEKDWQIDGTSIKPKQISQISPPLTSTEHQLHKLTSFVSFLEN